MKGVLILCQCNSNQTNGQTAYFINPFRGSASNQIRLDKIVFSAEPFVNDSSNAAGL